MTYRIFPSIGIARLGADPNFILGPEVPGAGPGELQTDGTLGQVTSFKSADKTKIRKRGARFYLFESAGGNTWVPANLPAGAQVTWTVTLENKKAAVKRGSSPSIAAVHPELEAGSESMVIKGGTRTVAGPNQTSAPFSGTFATTAPNGTAFNANVELGFLKTDAQGRLIVLGGSGISGAPAGVAVGPSFYKNPKWFDDVSDGPVKAEIRLTPTAAPVEAEGGAWVVVAPPDYAPGITCPVTLYDVVRQVGITHLALPDIASVSFDRDIAPLIERVRRLQFVHDDATWTDVRLRSADLRKTDAAHRDIRKEVRDLILKVQGILRGHVSASGPKYSFREFQIAALGKWVEGNFDDTPGTAPALTAAGLTQAALETCAGQGFCPGIEAGILVLDKAIWRTPFDFRLDHSKVKEGDLTALMAQPWQADFQDCNTEWWPTQRPDLAPQAAGGHEDWNRGATTKSQMVQRSSRLGLILQQGASEVFLEQERDPLL